MERNFKKILFEFIHSHGPMFGDKFCIIDNTGPKAEGSIHYRVFVKGGISFDISRDGNEYEFNSVWEGPLKIDMSVHVLAVLTIMGYSFTGKT